MAIRVGQIQIKVDGELIAIEGDWTVMPDGVSGEPETGPDGITTIVETPHAARISGNARDTEALDIKKVRALRGVVVTAEQSNGKVWVVNDADQISGEPINARQGTIPLDFVGSSADEVR